MDCRIFCREIPEGKGGALALQCLVLRRREGRDAEEGAEGTQERHGRDQNDAKGAGRGLPPSSDEERDEEEWRCRSSDCPEKGHARTTQRPRPVATDGPKDEREKESLRPADDAPREEDPAEQAQKLGR